MSSARTGFGHALIAAPTVIPSVIGPSTRGCPIRRNRFPANTEPITTKTRTVKPLRASSSLLRNAGYAEKSAEGGEDCGEECGVGGPGEDSDCSDRSDWVERRLHAPRRLETPSICLPMSAAHWPTSTACLSSRARMVSLVPGPDDTHRNSRHGHTVVRTICDRW